MIKLGEFKRAASTAAGVITATVLVMIATTAQAGALGVSYAAYRLGAPSESAVQEGDFIRSGEKLLLKIRYMNETATSAPAGSVIFSLPNGCSFLASQTPQTLMVSVDGGHTFGALDRLRVTTAVGSRAATRSDVTHLRMRLDHAVLPGESGEIRIIAAQD